jgi:hypothetical protein
MAEHDRKSRAVAPPSDAATPGKSAAGPQGDRLAGIAATLNAAPVQRAANRTGMPDQLKSGIEALSGMSLDHVRVHRNSAAPAQLNAHAYAQGADIHLGPGQEQHLPHEAWHVVQQAQGRVRPTMQMKAGVPVNDDRGLEAEADRMGALALAGGGPAQAKPVQRHAMPGARVVQRVVWEAGEDLTWNPIVDNSNRPPSHQASKPGEVFDDSTNKTYPNAWDYWVDQNMVDEDEKKDEDFVIEDSDEEYDDSGEDIDDEDSTVKPKVYPELTINERLDIERKAQRLPFDTSLLTPSSKFPTRELKTSDTFSKGKVMGKRTTQSGPVTITLEQIEVYEQDKLVKRERPIRVEGLVEETVTKGRGGAPDPFSGKQIYLGSGKAPKQSIVSERNSGMPDAERGHVMALELGGPDIAENIVPQWAKYQGADTWRKMEVAVLAKAKKLPKGQRLNYIVEVFYKSSGDLTPTLNTFSTPTGFKVTSQVIGAKGAVLGETVELHEGQSHDITDEKLRERKLKDIKEEGYDPALALAPPSKTRKRKPKDDSAPPRKPNKAPAKRKKVDLEVKKTPAPQVTKRRAPRKTPSKASPKTPKKTPGKHGKKGTR